MTRPLTLLFLLLAAALQAQDYYYGSVEDVFPLALERDTDGTGCLWVGQVDEGIAVRRDCSTGRGCVWRAADTALVLRGRFFDGAFEGVLRDGHGREREVLAQAYSEERVRLAIAPAPKARSATPSEWVGLLRERMRSRRRDSTAAPLSEAAFPTTFLSDCGTDKWVRAYASAGDDYRLTLAKLPAGRLRGSLYVAAAGTTLLADGTAAGRRLNIDLRRADGTPAGTIAAVVDGSLTGETATATPVRLAAKLTLADATLDLRLALAEEVRLACRQRDGLLDLLLPTADETAAANRLPAFGEATPRTLTELSAAHWSRLAAGGERGSVWFEPLRLDGDILSGLVHIRTDARRETHALNLDRRSGRLIPARRLATGPKRDRAHEAADRTRGATAAHPLRDDPDFRAWLTAAPLAHVTLLTEGLAYATERHPVYGTVHWVTPWGEAGVRF